MKIIYKSGDCLAGPEKFIAHGCNAQGVMGSGVAKAVRDRLPAAYKGYRAEFLENGLELGSTIGVDVDGVVVFNCITQNRYGPDGKRYVNYGAVNDCMNTINAHFKDYKFGIPHVAMPMIGAGLGMGDWGIISGIIEMCSTNFQPIVYDFTP